MNIDISLIEDKLSKLKRKDPTLFIAIQKKICQIASFDNNAVQHFKNLRRDLKDYKRVHIKSYVLIFKIEGNTLIFAKFCHHDEAY